MEQVGQRYVSSTVQQSRQYCISHLTANPQIKLLLSQKRQLCLSLLRWRVANGDIMGAELSELIEL